MATPTKEQVADLLKNARELMNNSGAHWIKGAYSTRIRADYSGGEPVFEHAYCSMGAIRHLTDEEGDQKIRWEATKALGEVEAIKAIPMTEADAYDIADRYEVAFTRIVRWNDADERTWADVDAAFREAEKRVRAS